MRSDEGAARVLISELSRRAPAENHKHGIIQSCFFKAWLSYRHDPVEMTLFSIDSALQHLPGIQQDTMLVKFHILKGQCFVKKTEFPRALKSFKTALAIARKNNDNLSETGALISIGWAYMEDGKPSEAVGFFQEVLRVHPETNYSNRALVLCNIASCYNTMGNFRESEVIAKKGIEAAKKIGSNTDLANGMNILGRSFSQQGRMGEAITILKQAAVVREKNADPSMLSSDYLELAELYLQTKEPKQAILLAKKAEGISLEGNNALKLQGVYDILAQGYEMMNDHKQAVVYLKKQLVQRDTVAAREYDAAMAEMLVEFETQKKTNENLQLKKQNLEVTLRNSEQKKILYLLFGIIAVIIASGIYISKSIQGRYKLRLANANIKEQKQRTLAVLKAEEAERRRIAADLHDGVCQTLAAAYLQLTNMSQQNKELQKAEELIYKAGEEVRTVSHKVTPEILLQHGLQKAIEQAIDDLNQGNSYTRFETFFHIEKPLHNNLMSLTLYRCFQELMNNAIKYAGAKKVSVQLNTDDAEIQLIVEDDGKGFIAENVNSGIGFRNIESRLSAWDGNFIIDSVPGKGSTFIISLQTHLINPI